MGLFTTNATKKVLGGAHFAFIDDGPRSLGKPKVSKSDTIECIINDIRLKFPREFHDYVTGNSIYGHVSIGEMRKEVYKFIIPHGENRAVNSILLSYVLNELSRLGILSDDIGWDNTPKDSPVSATVVKYRHTKNLTDELDGIVADTLAALA